MNDPVPLGSNQKSKTVTYRNTVMMEKATLSKGLRGIVFVRRKQLAKHFAILRWGSSNICGKTVLIFDTSQQTVLCRKIRFSLIEETAHCDQ